MKSIRVELVIAPSVDPRAMVGGLARLTQVRDRFRLADQEKGKKLIENLSAMGHTSLLEPLQFGVIIHGASRIFLAQITRHRQVSYVSQSQQYQDQTCFPYLVIPELDNDDEVSIAYHEFMTTSERLYRLLKAKGISRDQARYVIPGAARNDLFVDANARQWLEVIFPQRICRRNTLETRHVMALILQTFLDHGYEYLFKTTGPACLTTGKCDQGNMACNNPYKTFDEMLNIDGI